MPVNSNIGATVNDTNFKSGPVGSDNPGAQACPNCRKNVVPRPTNGIRQYSEPSGAPNSGAANVGKGTSAGYSCPSCGHNFTWTKSTGKAQGPVQSNKTNQNTAADM